MSKRIITVGHSPDPDDAFMFYVLAHDKIDTGDLTFRHELQDIETLNRRALKGELEVSAVSIHAYAHLLDRYALLPSGCSMGDRYGPMVIARKPMAVGDLSRVKIAVPGTMTTAFLTLRLLLQNALTPNPSPGGRGKTANPSPGGRGETANPSPGGRGETANPSPGGRGETANPSPGGRGETANPSPGGQGETFQYEVVPFDEIIGAVSSGKFDAGLIIHEGQLTFQNQGLHLIVDLGVWWQEKTGLPLPLGGNVVRRDLGSETIRNISRLIKESIRYSLDHRQDALTYALNYARDMDRDLADRFVGMYVNEWTLDYGPRGRAAVAKLLDEAHRAGVIPAPVKVEFVE